MTWCLQATSHQLSQCWSSFLWPCGVLRHQWVNDLQSIPRIMHMVQIVTVCTGQWCQHMAMLHHRHRHHPANAPMAMRAMQSDRSLRCFQCHLYVKDFEDFCLTWWDIHHPVPCCSMLSEIYKILRLTGFSYQCELGTCSLNQLDNESHINSQGFLKLHIKIIKHVKELCWLTRVRTRFCCCCCCCCNNISDFNPNALSRLAHMSYFPLTH